LTFIKCCHILVFMSSMSSIIAIALSSPLLRPALASKDRRLGAGMPQWHFEISAACRRAGPQNADGAVCCLSRTTSAYEVPEAVVKWLHDVLSTLEMLSAWNRTCVRSEHPCFGAPLGATPGASTDNESHGRLAREFYLD